MARKKNLMVNNNQKENQRRHKKKPLSTSSSMTDCTIGSSTDSIMKSDVGSQSSSSLDASFSKTWVSLTFSSSGSRITSSAQSPDIEKKCSINEPIQRYWALSRVSKAERLHILKVTYRCPRLRSDQKRDRIVIVGRPTIQILIKVHQTN